MKKNLLIFSLFFLIDRLTKYLAINGFLKSLKLGILSFELQFNRGISWGFFHSDNSITFLIISSIIFIVICYLSWNLNIKQKINDKIILSEMLIFSGAISNFMDRILFGGVADFILLSYRRWSWPIFNFADICIIVGMIMLLFSIINNPRFEKIINK